MTTTSDAVYVNSSRDTGTGSDDHADGGEDLGVLFAVVDATLVLLMGVAAVVGNAVVVVWAARFRRLSVPVNVYVINLAVTDFLFGLVLPLTVPNVITRR